MLVDKKQEQVDEEDLQTVSPIFQGPVPLGYDVEHFRKTGETKLMECLE
tara:strand:- start:150 stop:296 length:147 start_codon:yes stop_codon:yes gene_type:complete